MFEVTLGNVVVVLLVLWATTGLTLVHLGVLAVRFLRRPLRRPVPGVVVPPFVHRSLTFVVPVYNDAATVGPTVESLLRQTVRPDRILVVDDGSTDGTGAAIDAFRDRGVDVIHLPVNIGKVRALDAALRAVTTELVSITDADSIVDARYVEEMQRSFQDPDLVAAGGAVESIPHTWVTAARQIEYMLTVKVDRDAESAMNALVVLPGVSSTYRTAVLREMGFEFDTIAEDFDMTFRLQRAGRKIAMNLDAKVWTSDPPTLRMYARQLTRWYTDFWLVLKKHRKVLGKRLFGTVEVPLLVINATVSAVLYLVLPLWFAWKNPPRLLFFFASSFVVDLVLVVLAWRLYRRRDVWWALLSRTPTRFVGRASYLFAMTRVLVGKPGLAWTKLERRGTSDFLHRTRLPRSRAERRDLVTDSLWWTALTLVFASGVLLAFVPPAWAFVPAGVGACMLLFRALGRDLARGGRASPARVVSLALAEGLLVGAAAWVFGLIPLAGAMGWRIASLATAAQAASLLVLAPGGLAERALRWGGHAIALASTVALLGGTPASLVLCGYAAGLALVAGSAFHGGVRGVIVAVGAIASIVALALVWEPRAFASVGLAIAIAVAGSSLALVCAPPGRPREATA